MKKKLFLTFIILIHQTLALPMEGDGLHEKAPAVHEVTSLHDLVRQSETGDDSLIVRLVRCAYLLKFLNSCFFKECFPIYDTIVQSYLPISKEQLRSPEAQTICEQLKISLSTILELYRIEEDYVRTLEERALEEQSIKEIIESILPEGPYKRSLHTTDTLIDETDLHAYELAKLLPVPKGHAEYDRFKLKVKLRSKTRCFASKLDGVAQAKRQELSKKQKRQHIQDAYIAQKTNLSKKLTQLDRACPN